MSQSHSGTPLRTADDSSVAPLPARGIHVPPSSRSPRRKTFNDRPLVWFTSLAIGGAGTIFSAALRMPADPTSPAVGLALGTAALGAGLLVSMLHLGRKSRAPLAVRAVGRSALSHEVLLAGATLALGFALAVMYWQSEPHAWARIATATIAALFLLSIGQVYRLGGQRTWRGATAFLPFTTGLVCGEVLLQAIGHVSARELNVAFWPIFIPVDAVVFAARWWAMTRTASAGTPRGLDPSRLHGISAARLLIFDVVPLVLLHMQVAGPAIVAVVLGLALDRWLLYALADQHTTEAEIARVEAVIERGSRIR